MATRRQVHQVVEAYQNSRVTFSQTVAELSSNPQNADVLHTAGVMDLLRPLLIDCVPQIQQTAALGLGRLANHNEGLAEAVVAHNLLIQLNYSLREQNTFSKKAAASVLRSISKHTPNLAQEIVNSGALEQLVLCLEEFDPSVKEVGANVLGNIAKHNPQLAHAVVDAGANAFLVLCIQEPELSLRRSAVGALADIAKHTPELAQSVVDAGTVPFVAPLVSHNDAKLKRQVFLCLGHIARHSIDLAEVVVAANVFPKLFLCLKDLDPHVRKNGAIVVCEVAKHSPQLAQFIVSSGGVAALIDNAAETRGSERLPAIMTLGFIAAFDDALAKVIISSNGIHPLMDALTSEHEDHIKSASAWSLGQIGRHSPVHALAVAEAGVLPKLVLNLLSSSSSEDFQNKCRKALKAVIEHLTHLPALDSLLQGPILPENILKLILTQLAKNLPLDPDLRTKFVTSGGFEKLQQLPIAAESELKELLNVINNAYPIEIVQYYSPGYSEILLQQLTTSKPSAV